ncbi:MAG TPA: TonB-dependent receptor [Thermoanaerobaculia bacterium]|nr:TonB-dependent receptor [Thermoanaerobaculia bacterium]
MKRNLLWRIALVLVAVAAMTGLAFGQAQNGNMYGRVVAEDGSSLPGVAVQLSGGGPTLDFMTDSRGDFRFLQLAPGDRYEIKCELSGFGTVNQKNLIVNVGKNTELRIVMRVAKAEAQVTVRGEAPILDTRRIGTGATISRSEMDAIPSARDPWVVVQTVPGVQIDRINVGGNQSGQQSIFTAKGSQTSQGSWNLDGVTVSDVASGSSSPTYWDFDSFQEIQAVTGGNDITVQSMGVTMNMVTKRGTNDVRGSARVYITDPKMQSDPTLKPEMQRQKTAAGGVEAFRGNQITGIQDYGIEVGGPVLKDRFWLWGSYGRDQIDLLTATGVPDKTTLEDINMKANIQAIESNGLTFFYLRGDKRKSGRNSSPFRPLETTVTQSGPTALYKIEDNQVVSSNFVVDAFWSFMDEGFQLVGAGGPVPQAFQDANSVWHNSFASSYFGRPQRQILGTANYFLSTGPLGHEFKLGGGVRKAETRSKTLWPGQGIIAFGANGTCFTPAGVTPRVTIPCGAITRNSNRKDKDDYINFFFSDTITMDRLTATLGVRYDDSKGSIQASSVGANVLYPTILPGASAPAVNSVIHWKNWSPRVGLTYAIGDARKTLARASYARYANGLGSYPTSQLGAIPGVAYAYFPWTDINKNNLVDTGELDLATRLRTVGYNPANPSAPVSVNLIDPKLTSQKTDEFVAGLDHEVFPNFAVGAAYTHRKYTNFYFAYRSAGGVTPTYVFDHNNVGTLPDGTSFTAPIYSISPVPPPPGNFFTNRPNYTQSFDGAELTMTKRMSSGWMMRGNVAWNNNKQRVGAGACVDPTNGFYSSGEDSVPGACENGGIVAPNAGGGSGAFGQVNLNQTWSFNLSGAYQLPLGFTVAGNYFGRQGYPIAYYVIDAGADGLSKRAYATTVDKYRNGWVSQWDMRLDKSIPITSTVTANIAVDCFNVLNLNTVLQRNARLKQPSLSTGTNTVFETQSPRIFRIGGRVSF